MSPGAHPNGSLKRAIRAAERRLARGERLTATELEALETQVAGADALPAALSRRLARLMAIQALRSRRAPEGALDGFYADVRSATLGERPGRARVSNAYLDAPRSLAAWRRTAAAACVLAVVSAGWALTLDDAPSAAPVPTQLERYALLDGVLDRFDPAAPAPTAGGPQAIYPVGVSGSRGAVPSTDSRSRPMIQVFRGRWQSGVPSLHIRIRGRAPAVGTTPVEIEKN